MENLLTWSTVRTFGSIKYFNISYIVLFMVPILSELHIKASNASPAFKDLIAFPSTLKWVYGASILYAIAIAIYQYYCPQNIKHFYHENDYIKNTISFLLRAHPENRLSIILAQLDKDIEEETINKIRDLQNKLSEAPQEKKLSIENNLKKMEEDLLPDALQRYLLKKYRYENISVKPALYLSFILYSIGTTILLILLIIRSLKVFGVV